VEHVSRAHLLAYRVRVHPPVLFVLVLLRVEHARHALDVAEAVDVLRGRRLRPDDEVREDEVVICWTKRREGGRAGV
jgi:hypothetical protein